MSLKTRKMSRTIKIVAITLLRISKGSEFLLNFDHNSLKKAVFIGSSLDFLNPRGFSRNFAKHWAGFKIRLGFETAATVKRLPQIRPDL
jgi:hypothetical protein